MKCFNCNQTIPEGSDICPNCGQRQSIDQALIDAARKGDENALTDLYNRTTNAVYNTVKFLVKDEDAALDILQDTYIKAFSSLDQLQEAAKFPAWIKRISHNKAIDYLRKAQPLSFSSLSDEEDGEEPQFEDDRPENLPETVMDRKETARLIGEILDSLPDDQRACITLFYYDQLSIKEIADELGVAEATVKSRLQYARKKIEARVRDLEKSGTKLYGFAPLPFLLFLFRKAEEGSVDEALTELLPEIIKEAAPSLQAAAETAASEAVESAVTKEAAEAAAGAAKAAAAKAAVGATGGIAGASLTTKIIAGVLALALIGGGGAAISKAINKTPAEPAPQAQPIPEPPAPPEEPPTPPEPEGMTEEELKANVDAVYDEVLGEYAGLVEMGKDAFMENYGDKYVDYPSGGINYLLPFDAFQGEGELLWGRYDYNGDGIDELVLALDSGGSRQVYAVYTSDGEKFYELADGQHMGYRINLNVLPDGNFMIHGSGGVSTWSDTICKISEDGKSLDIIEKYLYDEISTGSTDYVGEKETLTAEEFDEKYGSKAVDATKYGDIKFHLLASTWKSEEEPKPEPENTQADPSAYNPVFEEIRAGYEACMYGEGKSPFIDYSEVQWTVENKADVGGVTYAIYDINKDGTPEMIMGYPEFYIPDSDTNFTVYEIYAFDRDHAVPLSSYFETKYDYINIYDDGTIRTHVGNGGDPTEEVYLIPAFGAYLDHTGTASINDDYRPEPADIHYTSILKYVG